MPDNLGSAPTTRNKVQPNEQPWLMPKIVVHYFGQAAIRSLLYSTYATVREADTWRTRAVAGICLNRRVPMLVNIDNIAIIVGRQSFAAVRSGIPTFQKKFSSIKQAGYASF
jgi:hypothetical protein